MEEEIHNGIMKAEKPEETCHWFQRTIADLEYHRGDEDAKHYVDIDGDDIDEDAQKLLVNLK